MLSKQLMVNIYLKGMVLLEYLTLLVVIVSKDLYIFKSFSFFDLRAYA